MKRFIPFLFLINLVIGCTKQIDSTISTTTTTTTSSTAPNIRFFNVMDYGNVSIQLNTKSIGDVAQYYPTTYKIASIGTTNIKIIFGGGTAVDQNIDLLAGKSYSCFVYRVGYNWKISVITDDLTKPTSNNSNIRVLDFRTQAYFDYVNIKFSSPGNSTLEYAKRNFLDHQSYDYFTNYKTILAGTYNFTIYNTTVNLLTKSNVLFESTKIYSVILMTQASQTAAEALQNIKVDVEQH